MSDPRSDPVNVSDSKTFLLIYLTMDSTDTNLSIIDDASSIISDESIFSELSEADETTPEALFGNMKLECESLFHKVRSFSIQVLNHFTEHSKPLTEDFLFDFDVMEEVMQA